MCSPTKHSHSRQSKYRSAQAASQIATFCDLSSRDSKLYLEVYQDRRAFNLGAYKTPKALKLSVNSHQSARCTRWKDVEFQAPCSNDLTPGKRPVFCPYCIFKYIGFLFLTSYATFTAISNTSLRGRCDIAPLNRLPEILILIIKPNKCTNLSFFLE